MTDPSEQDRTKPGPAVDEGRPSFFESLGARYIEAPDGAFRIELDLEPRHSRSLAISHGGVLASLLDTVMGVAASRRAPAGLDTVTAQLNINFIRPAKIGETVRATSEIKHSGALTSVVMGELRNPKGELVATGTGTFLYPRLPRPVSGGSSPR